MSDLPVKQKVIRLSREEWGLAEEMWRSGENTLADISKKFRGISPEYLSKKFKEGGVIKGSTRREIERRVQEELAKRAELSANVKANQLEETLKQSYDWALALQKLNMQIVVMAAKEPAKVVGELEGAYKALKALNMAANTNATLRSERLVALGVRDYEYDQEKELPTLPIVEMTAEDIAEVRASFGKGLEHGDGHDDGDDIEDADFSEFEEIDSE